VDQQKAKARRDFAIGRNLSAVTLATWPLLYAERFVDAPYSEGYDILLVGLVLLAMACTLPLIVYTVRVVRASVPAWRKTIVVAGLLAGAASYVLVFFAYIFGLGLAMGAH
jgi:hypothetical protein